MSSNDNDELKVQAKQIANRVNQDNMQSFLEGQVYRILTLERELASLKISVYALAFIIFILPVFFK